MGKNKFVIRVEGGLGKHVMTTSLIRWINEKFPERPIIVVSGYPEVFENNPRVYRTLHFGQAYLFEDYIKGNDFRQGEPYTLSEYYNDKLHFCDLLPRAYLFESTDSEWKTELYPSEAELSEAIDNAKSLGGKIITIQCSGGSINLPTNLRKDVSNRDMDIKTAEEIVDYVKSKGFQVIQIRSGNDPILSNALHFNGSTRQLFAFTTQILGHIGIDSSMMHICGAMGKPMVILWGETESSNLGYPNTINVGKGNGSRPHVALPDQRYCLPYTNNIDKPKIEEIKSAVDKLLGRLK